MPGKHYVIALLCLFVQLSCQQSQSQGLRNIQLQVTKLADGDSFEGWAEGLSYRIRLYGIDAPERGMDFYRKSKDRLGALCAQGPVLVKPRSKDSFGRWVADVYTANGQHINYILVEEGLAWHFTKYSNDPELKRLETGARNARIGIWSLPDPTPPWQFRKDKRKR